MLDFKRNKLQKVLPISTATTVFAALLYLSYTGNTPGFTLLELNKYLEINFYI